MTLIKFNFNILDNIKTIWHIEKPAEQPKT